MSGTLAKGTPVISLDTGVTLGKIERVFFDCESRRLVAFSFSRGTGLFGRKGGHIVEIDDIHAIGPDAVTLDDARAVHDLVLMDGATRSLIELDELVRRDVMTAGGAKLGHIVGLDFDPDTYRLVNVRIDDRHRDEELVLPAADVQNIGQEIIVVADPPAERTALPRPTPSIVPTPWDRRIHDDGFRRAG